MPASPPPSCDAAGPDQSVVSSAVPRALVSADPPSIATYSCQRQSRVSHLVFDHHLLLFLLLLRLALLERLCLILDLELELVFQLLRRNFENVLVLGEIR